jgi:hypothetical protein
LSGGEGVERIPEAREAFNGDVEAEGEPAAVEGGKRKRETIMWTGKKVNFLSGPTKLQ